MTSRRPSSPEITKARARLAAAKRHHPDADHSKLAEDLEAAKARAGVRRALALDDPVALAEAARIIRPHLARYLAEEARDGGGPDAA